MLQASLARAPDGGLLLGGGFDGSLEFGSHGLAGSGQGWSGFVAKLDAAHEPTWAVALPGTPMLAVWSLGVASDGSMSLVGQFEGELDLGVGAPLMSDGIDGFLLKMSANGVPQWAQRFGGQGPDRVESVAVSQAGDILIGGVFSASVEVASTTMIAANGRDAFAARFDSAGGLLHARHLETPGEYARAPTVAFEPDGHELLAGAIRGGINLGAGMIYSSGLSDAFVARYTPQGALIWQRHAGAGGETGGGTSGVAADESGKIVAVGEFMGEPNWGNGALLGNTSDTDVFVLKLSP